jgi:hypothetical protein
VILLSSDDVLIAIREECPECGAPAGTNCYGVSGLVINATIIPKGDGSPMDFFVVHDERLPPKQKLRLVKDLIG